LPHNSKLFNKLRSAGACCWRRIVKERATGDHFETKDQSRAANSLDAEDGLGLQGGKRPRRGHGIKEIVGKSTAWAKARLRLSSEARHADRVHDPRPFAGFDSLGANVSYIPAA